MLSFEINVMFAVYYAFPTAIKRTLGLYTGELAKPKYFYEKIYLKGLCAKEFVTWDIEED